MIWQYYKTEFVFRYNEKRHKLKVFGNKLLIIISGPETENTISCNKAFTCNLVL
jgi:hypothetical protein